MQVCVSFPFGFESGVWGLIVLIPDYCLSIYFKMKKTRKFLISYISLFSKREPCKLSIRCFNLSRVVVSIAGAG